MSRGPSRPPTSADVARAAGVSRSTVSYVLNDSPGVRISEPTRARVRAAAAALGYVPNIAAADLRRGGSRLVIGIAHQMRAPVVVALSPRLSTALRARGLTFLTAAVADDVTAEEAAGWAALRPALLLNHAATLTAGAAAVLRAHGTTVVGNDGEALWAYDPVAVVSAGVGALRERGYERLLQILPADPTLVPFTAGRAEAFAQLAGTAGVGTMTAHRGEAGAAACVASLRDLPVAPDAVLAFDDTFGAELIGALTDASVRVPGDVAVLGLGGTSPPGLRPTLSGLVVDPAAVVEAMAGHIVDLVAGQAPARDLVLTTELTVRHAGST